MRQLTKDIYEIVVPLPDSPLKAINCHVIKGQVGERSLLIDTAFDHPECERVLLEG